MTSRRPSSASAALYTITGTHFDLTELAVHERELQSAFQLLQTTLSLTLKSLTEGQNKSEEEEQPQQLQRCRLVSLGTEPARKEKVLRGM